MSINALNSIDLDLLEMRCPVCGQTQQILSRSLSLEPRLTACYHCKTLLVYQLTIKTKPNHVLLSLVFTPVPDAQTTALTPTQPGNADATCPNTQHSKGEATYA